MDHLRLAVKGTEAAAPMKNRFPAECRRMGQRGQRRVALQGRERRDCMRCGATMRLG